MRRLAEWVVRGRLAELEAALQKTVAERDEHVVHQRMVQVAHDEVVQQRAMLLDAVRVAESAQVLAEAEQRRIENEHFATRERFYTSSDAVAGLARGLSVPDEELIASLRESGVSASPDDRVTLHVGFGHAATTTLQLSFFAEREDLYYPGTPYQDAGGFFTWLKSHEDYLLDSAEMLRYCEQTVYAHPERRGRPIVVSDELFCEPAEVYYNPCALPGDVIAVRLKRFFPKARVVFTIRNQADYVRSLYFNLKRNYGYLAGMPMPPFDEWWQGRLHSQSRGTQLVNLDFAPLVRVYAELFGQDRVLVLPLEELKTLGAAKYLGRLCQFMDIPLHDADVQRYYKPRNERMSVVEERVAELLAARHSEPALREALANQSLAELTGAAPRATIALSDDVKDEIRKRVSAGNRWLAETFHLPLKDYGYEV